MAAALRITLFLPLLCFIPGFLLLRLLHARGGIPRSLGAAELIFISVLISVLAASWLGLALAGLALFSLRAVSAVMAAASVALLALTGLRRPFLPLGGGFPRWRSAAAGLLLAPAAIFLFSPPYEYVLGNWDPGTYVNVGARLAREGSIMYRDRVLVEIPYPDRELFYYTHLVTQRYEGGVAISDSRNAVVSPHFYHLYTVWIALFNTVAGIGFSLRVNLLFGLLSLAALYFAGRELSRGVRADERMTGFLAAALLACAAAQVWSVRFPTAEVAAQCLIMSGLFCLFRYQDEGLGLWAVLSGACFAEALLTVFTAVTLLPLLIIVLFWRNWDRWERRDALLAAPLAGGLLTLALLDATMSRHYIQRQMEVLRSQGLSPRLLVAATICFLAALAFARIFLKRGKKRASLAFESSAFRTALGIALVLAFAFAYYLRPLLDDSADARNLRELGWFVYPLSAGRLYFPLGLYLALAGAIILIRDGLDGKRGAFLFLALPSTAFLIFNKMIFPSYFWAVRRYIPLVIPSLILFMAYGLARFAGTSRLRRLVAGAITVVLLACMLTGYTLTAMAPDFAGTLDFMDRLASGLDPGGLFICEGSGIASALDCAYGLDVLQLSDQSPEKCRGVERVVTALLGSGRRVYYISRGGWPVSASLAFMPLSDTPLETDRLEHSVGRFPRARVPVSVSARVFRVERIGASPEGGARLREIEIGEDCFALVSGFHEPLMRWEMREGRRERAWVRWTKGEAELVIPTFGSSGDLEVSLRASAGKNRPSLPIPVRVFVNGKKAADISVGGEMEELRFTIPARLLMPGSERAVLKFSCSAWDPASCGMSGHPPDLGICIDRLAVEKAGD